MISREEQINNIQKTFWGYCAGFAGQKKAYVTVTPTDRMTLYFGSTTVAEEIINDIPQEYREHVITLEPTQTFGLQPVLEGIWQDKFYQAKTDYINTKADFYNK
jgi:hypothetical protein